MSLVTVALFMYHERMLQLLGNQLKTNDVAGLFPSVSLYAIPLYICCQSEATEDLP